MLLMILTIKYKEYLYQLFSFGKIKTVSSASMNILKESFIILLNIINYANSHKQWNVSRIFLWWILLIYIIYLFEMSRNDTKVYTNIGTTMRVSRCSQLYAFKTKH